MSRLFAPTAVSKIIVAAVMFVLLVPNGASATDGQQPATIVDVPAAPSVNDPCGENNAAWVMPGNDETFNWFLSGAGEALVTIVPPDTTFPDGTSGHNYGLAVDSGQLCADPEPTPDPLPTPAPAVKWTAFEKRCMNGTMSSAHRGMGFGLARFAGKVYAEDTPAALVKGLQLGVCAVETDIWQTADGCLVSHHDGTLNRMTNRSGAIRQHSCKYVTGARNSNGAPVATFEAVQRHLKRAAPWTCFRQQEVKRGAISPSGLRRIVAFNAKVAKSPACIMYTASEASTLRYLHRLSPRSKFGLIVRSKFGRPATGTVPAFIDRVMLDYRAVSAQYVRQAQAAGFEVSARNVDSLSLFQRMKSIGLRYIVTNKPWVIGVRR